MEFNIEKRIERRGETDKRVLAEEESQERVIGTGSNHGNRQPKKPAMSSLVMIRMISVIWNPTRVFLANDSMNQSILVELYSLLKPDTFSNLDRNGKVETSVHEGNVQMKQYKSSQCSDAR